MKYEIVVKIIANLYSKGKPVLLLGYELGKAQTLSQLFGDWDPIYYHDSVKKIKVRTQALTEITELTSPIVAD